MELGPLASKPSDCVLSFRSAFPGICAAALSRPNLRLPSSERSNVALRLTVIPAISLTLAVDVDKAHRGRTVGYETDGFAM